MFNCFGPLNDRAGNAFLVLHEMMHYARTQAVHGKLKPGGWADAILDAVDRDEVDEAARPAMIDRLHGAAPRHDDLRDRQRRVAFRETSGPMANRP